jgi:hypothetical protein
MANRPCERTFVPCEWWIFKLFAKEPAFNVFHFFRLPGKLFCTVRVATFRTRWLIRDLTKPSNLALTL